MSHYQVVWKGPVGRSSGLGIASREYVQALKRQGVDVRIGSARGQTSWRGKQRKRTVLIYHYSPNTINFKQERKKYDSIILNTVWETTRIPNNWISKMNQFDAVCVPSIQNRKAMRNSGVKVPIFIVPHGVHTQAFTPANKKLPLPEAKDRFVFVSVFGFQHRKNPEGLLKAYWEQFSSDDKVLLVIKTNGYSASENDQWIRNKVNSYKRKIGIRKSTAPLVIITKRQNQQQLKGIYTLGNAFVLPTRGEGVGLPFLEALASGVPVIATGWGGHMDFVTNKNSFPVTYKLQNPAGKMNHAISRKFNYLFAQKGQLWAEPNIESLKQQMRTAYQQPLLCKQKGEQGRRDVLHLSWDRAGNSLKRAVETVLRFKK